jgi:Mg-chelatase subunit ChlI
MFLRVLLSRRAIAFEPSSIVWHRHRDDTAGLSKQVHAYGTGLSACMTVHALNPATAAQLARVVVAGSRHMWSTTGAARDSVALAGSGELAKAERRGILAGPLSLVRERLAGSKRRPLAR